VLLAFSLPGCGLAGGQISGKVRFNGSPVKSGWVTLTYTNGNHAPVSGFIQPDGTYRIAGCPSGEARVTVRVATRSSPRKKTTAPKTPSIPTRYADAEKTDLVCKVTGGSQEFDIELKP
jgi:hypothetical protein